MARVHTKVGVIGERACVMGFAALGLSVYPVEEGQEALDTFRRLARCDQYAIIFITEALVGSLSGEITKYKDKADTAVIVIPGRAEPQGLGLHALKQAVERAVGVDLLAK